MREAIPDMLDRAAKLTEETVAQSTEAIIAKANKPATPDIECRDCGEPIGEARKLAIPFAVLCIYCATDEERQL